jgi:hypothetical protein
MRYLPAVTMALLVTSQSAAVADQYPAAGVRNLQFTCAQRKDVPPQRVDAYCRCYVARVQSNVSWREHLLFDSAIGANGIDEMDPEAKEIRERLLADATYCYRKNVR